MKGKSSFEKFHFLPNFTVVVVTLEIRVSSFVFFGPQISLDGATNFISWNSIFLISEEKDLLKLVNEKIREPDAEKDKSH